MSMEEDFGACLVCERVRMAQEGRNPYLVTELDHTIVVIGDHQFHRGYTLVLLKEHVRELHELDSEVQLGQFAEVMRAGKAVAMTFGPWKMNYACYGNSEPHLHWHIFPRRADDPNRELPPWADWQQFDRYRIDDAEARALASRVRSAF